MILTRNRQDTSDLIKGYLRNVPLIYGGVKWIYRLFRGSDPTMQQQILKAIGNKTDVFFVQVGSNDGVQGDPIHDLIIAREHWRGIFIEPINFLFCRLRKNYGDCERFVFENVAISNRSETKKFYYVSEKAKTELELPYWHDQLGSFDKNHITRLLGDQMQPYIIEGDVECQPLQVILDRNRVDAIDLLHIDTEGFDYQVLSQVEFKRYKPSAILFEHHLLTDDEFFKARKLLRSTGYRLLQYGNDTLALRRSFWIRGATLMSTTLRNRANWSFGLPKTVHAFGVNIILLPLGIATSVLIARSVGPTGKGSFDLIIATAALLTMVLGVSLPPGITYVVAQGKVSSNVLAWQLVLVSLVQGLLALVIVSLLQLTAYSHIFLPNWGLWVVAGVVVYVWVDMLNKFWGAILIGQQQIAIVNNSELVGRMTQFVTLFIVAGVLYLSQKTLTVSLLFLVSLSATILIGVLLLTSLGLKFQPSRDLSGLKAAFAFALPCYGANTAQFLNYRMDVFVVGFFAGATSVGRYTLAVSLGQLLWLMSNSVASVLLPKVAASSDAGATISHTTRVTRLSLWATALGALALALLATQAIPLLYGEAFRPSIAALVWLLPGIVVFSIANVLAAYIAGIGKPHLNLWVSGISLVITIALDLILIPKLNIVGASIASTVSYSVSAVMLTMFFVRETGASLRQVLLPNSEDLNFARQLVQPLLRRVGLQRAV